MILCFQFKQPSLLERERERERRESGSKEGKMLQRAASNAYSWWWASHIRTKQSNWLEQNLQDMEEKVHSVLSMIQEDGDSFAKRAEMYYRRRPELISFVEETYKAYRALAERYDHISKELQNANNTIASVFPERVQFAMDEDDERNTRLSSPRIQKKKFPESPKPKIPTVPKPPNRDLKGLLTLATKKLQAKKALKAAVAKSGLSKPEAVEEIDNLQKGILSLQTEKEFMKSSYEHGLAKYWEIENQITEKQERICSLQDEFSVGSVIEDEEARSLMAAAALRSCQETLANLQGKQERSGEEARVEHKRIEDARKKLVSLKTELLPSPGQLEHEKPFDKGESVNAGEKMFKNMGQEEGIETTEERQKLESLREKIKEYFDVGSNTTLTVSEMAEKIDELVNKVINLETAVLSQTAVVNRLRTETDELQAHISTLEDEKKGILSNGTNNLSDQLRKMEEKLNGIQYLDRNVEDQNNHLHTYFTEARCNLDQLSENVRTVKPDEEEELETTDLSDKEDGSLPEVETQKESKEQDNTTKPDDPFEEVRHAKPDEKVVVTGSLQNDEKELTEARCNLDQLSENVRTVKPDEEEELETTDLSDKEDGSLLEVETHKESKEQDNTTKPDDTFEEVRHAKPDEKVEVTGSLQNYEKELTEARCNLDQLSENVRTVKPDEEEELETTVLSDKEDGSLPEVETHKESKEQDNTTKPDDTFEEVRDAKPDEKVEVTGSLQNYEKEQKDPLNHGDAAEKSRDVQVEMREESREQDVGTSVKNQEEEENQVGRLRVNNDPDIPSQKSHDPKMQEIVDKQDSPETADGLNIHAQELESEQEDEPNWRQMFLHGLENREKNLLNEYTSILRNFKEIKKKLGEVEKKNQDSLIETTVQLKELRSANGMKDEEIRSLRQKLSLLLASLDENQDLKKIGQDIEHIARSEESTATETLDTLRTENEEEMILTDQPQATSVIEDKFRMKIDEVLEENLDFWLRFSSSFHQIQKFQTEVEDLQAEISKLEERLKNKQDGGSTKDHCLKSDARPIYKHLREIETELTLWLEQSVILKDDLQGRFTSLCNIQEEILRALKESSEDEAKLTSYQAAKFQGEVLNMKQENNKVDEELQAGLDHVTTLQLDIQRTLAKLDEDFELSGSKNNQNPLLKHSTSRSRVPLRLFIFGDKQKKHRTSIFSSMHPALRRRHNDHI